MNHPPTKNEARISEIFSSLQGEGIRMGERHLFIRFEECHIHCEYCDELSKTGRAMSLEEVLQEVLRIDREDGPHSYVSLTGGEPLLYQTFLAPLLLRLKALGFGTYLETNGILWPALESVIGWCDLIAMDLKPASVTKEKSFLAEHRRFLEIAKGKEVFIKIVLSKEIDIQEFQQLILLVRDVAAKTPVILQPLTGVAPVGQAAIAGCTGGGWPLGLPALRDRRCGRPFVRHRAIGSVEGHDDEELMQLLGELQRLARRMIPDVRIMPRLHRILKIR